MTEEREGYRRVTVRYDKPNPLFEEWLTELYNNAVAKASSKQYFYGKALRALQKYPLPLKSGKECLILDYFGAELCKYLDWKLKKDEDILGKGGENSTQKPVQVEISRASSSNRDSSAKSSPQKNKKNNGASPKKKNTGTYVPAWRSGPYAFLLTLLSHESHPDFPGYLTKAELLKEAQPLCDASLTKPIPGSRYTGWSSMSILQRKALVNRTGNPARFSLTEEGKQLALKIVNAESGTSSSPPSKAFELSQPVVSKQPSISSQNDLPTVSFSQPVRRENSSSSSKRTASKRPTKEISPIKNISPSSYSESDNETHGSICLQPDTFDIILLVDTSETVGNGNKTMPILADFKICMEARRLKVGDFAWIARDRSNDKNELLLPFIVERKRMDDLGKSIKDGRFHEQKFRLKQSGITNLIYLVENYGKNEHLGLPLASVQQAAVNTRVVDGFQVKYTSDHAHSMAYIAVLTQTFKTVYKEKILVSCRKKELADKNLGPKADVAFLITYSEFNKSSSKIRSFTIREMLIRQLLQLHGLSVEKALAIANNYQTPRALMEAFETKGEDMLANVPFGTNNRKLGSPISKALHQLYTSLDLS